MGAALPLLATAAVGAYSANEAGKAQQKLANRNADLQEEQAADSLVRGEEEVLATKRRIRRTVGAQRAAFAGQGVDVGTGTARDLQEETRQLGDVDIATIRKNAWREMYYGKSQASNTRLSANYARRGAQNQAVGTLLGGVGDAYPYFRPDAPRPVGG
jgi:hypothetical protein